MTLTLETPREAAMAATEVWTVPGEQNGLNHGFGSGDARESRLLDDLESAFAQRRLIDAKIARLSVDAGEMMKAARAVEAPHVEQSSRSVAELLVDVGRISRAEAHRYYRVGLATEQRWTLVGQPLPIEYGLVRGALDDGSIPLDSANYIVSALAQAAPRADADDLLAAEDALVAFARECPADLVRRVANSWREALDVDGIEPREEALAALISLRRTIRPNGMKRYIIDADPIGAAYLDAAIDSHVGANIRRPSFASADSGAGSAATDSDSDADDALVAQRTIAQLGAEAIFELARHGIACTNPEIPIRAATIVVRMTLESLLSGLGEANIDGIEQPISAATARWMAAEANIIPLVLGADGQVLDLGTTQRLFSPAQKVAMGELFGGCAWRNCQLSPSHTEAHHLVWWRNSGRSDLRNGILLCSKHHHEVHRNNWLIEVRDGVPWFIPPSTIDPRRTPRRGGKAPRPAL
ncbi:HNH endonuclease signature motif containing protein [Lacisediminihabitans profunda]|uniref:DUF222 domain-containing protein n=1 Tax=Lacisediminihabitans profunda TaxID=2594790 RepID=A0A5C8URA1_9MICO|nr:HNH endonuclease signature motif containing protein [Lacisediminihabitans profunda]TXN31101.1 DUF222 domain-containing protein [Lacisediminihabitans profunda]